MGELKMERLWSPKDLAEWLSMDIQWVWKETREGRIPRVKNTGKVMKYDPELMRRHFSSETIKKK